MPNIDMTYSVTRKQFVRNATILLFNSKWMWERQRLSLSSLRIFEHTLS